MYNNNSNVMVIHGKRNCGVPLMGVESKTFQNKLQEVSLNVLAQSVDFSLSPSLPKFCRFYILIF